MVQFIELSVDLLVHKILLNSVLLSPIVSSGVRPTPPLPRQTPLGSKQGAYDLKIESWIHDYVAHVTVKLVMCGTLFLL